MILPTIGRVVWFWKDPRMQPAQTEPMAAIIAKVTDVDTVNLCVIDHGGDSCGVQNVTLWHGAGPPPRRMYCEWMPYQKGQAAKTEELERLHRDP